MSPAKLVPTRTAEAEVREKGSVFLAVVMPVASAEGAEEALAALRRRYPDATHHCWAWRLGAEASERSSDDGEPGGTAGVPMLQVLRGSGLTDVLAVVVRWFGGTKLGKGGLARAYAAAVKEALPGLAPQEQWVRHNLTLDLPYERLGAVKRLLRPPEIELLAERYGARVELELAVAQARLALFVEALADLGLAPRGVLPKLEVVG